MNYTCRAYDTERPTNPPLRLGVTTANIAAANTIRLPANSSLQPSHLKSTRFITYSLLQYSQLRYVHYTNVAHGAITGNHGINRRENYFIKLFLNQFYGIYKRKYYQLHVYN